MTSIHIENTDFYINGEPSYKGHVHEGRRIEGLLLNSRMVQAIFDDANPKTVSHWAYPDTARWDPDRNTDEFCDALPTYVAHGLRAVTVGLQGGGSIYASEVYDAYINNAFTPEGDLNTPHFERLARILEAADDTGMVVIVNYFYFKQIEKMVGEAAVIKATKTATEWLLKSGYRNILVDVYNEVQTGDALNQSRRIHELVQAAQSVTDNGRRLLVGVSTHPWDHWCPGEWRNVVDFMMPHGNDSPPDKLRKELREYKQHPAYLAHPRPILINEDSVDIRNLDVAVDEGCSWGYYSQGYGSAYKDMRFDWTEHGRESQYSDLSGYQTVPVNWGINTSRKRAFFNRVKEITGV